MRRGYQPTKTMTFNSKPPAPNNTPSEKGEKMRLIDADALNYSTHTECAGHGDYYDIEIITKSKIDNAPTIDAEPIKHGYWEEEFNGNGWNDFWDYTCSVCGKKWERADDVLYTSNFCPNCGAKMSRKDDE